MMASPPSPPGDLPSLDLLGSPLLDLATSAGPTAGNALQTLVLIATGALTGPTAQSALQALQGVQVMPGEQANPYAVQVAKSRLNGLAITRQWLQHELKRMERQGGPQIGETAADFQASWWDRRGSLAANEHQRRDPQEVLRQNKTARTAEQQAARIQSLLDLALGQATEALDQAQRQGRGR